MGKRARNNSWWQSASHEVVAYLATALLIAGFYWPRWIGPASFILGDGLDHNVPHRVYATRVIQEGRLPHWSDVTFGGFPFLSDPQTAVFFPPYLMMELSGWIPDSSARFDALAFSFVLASGLGVVALARVLGAGRLGAVAAGVFFALNGYMVNHLSHTVITSAIAAAVWGMVFLALALRRQSRRAWWLAALFFASSILAGHWQTALFGFYAAGALAFYLVAQHALAARSGKLLVRGLIDVALLFIIAVALATVQVLPTLELLRHTTREKLSFEAARAYSLPARQLLGLFLPGLYQPLFWRVPLENRWELCWSTWGIDGAWEFHFWVGLVAPLLMLFGFLTHARRPSSWILAGTFVFVIVAAMGQDIGLYHWMYRNVPGFKQIRIPPRLMWVGYLAGALLLARAVDALFTLPPWPWRRWGAIAAILLALVGCAYVIALFVWAYWLNDDLLQALEMLLVINPQFRVGVHRSEGDFLADISHQVLVGTGFFLAALLWIGAAASVRRRKLLLGLLAPLLLWGELGVYGFFKNIRVGDRGFQSAITPMHALLGETVTGRLHALVPGPWEKNTGEASGIPMTMGYNPMILRWYDHHFPPEEPSRGLRSRENLLDVWNVSHVVAPGNRAVVSLPASSHNVAVTTATGSVYLATASVEHRPALEFSLATTAPRHLYLLSAAMGVMHEADGTTVGLLTLLTKDNNVITSYPIRLGHETAEWTCDDPDLTLTPAHNAPARAFTERGRDVTSSTTYFVAKFDPPTTLPVRKVRVEAKLAAPRWLAVAGLVEEPTEGPPIDHTAIEAFGYYRCESRNPQQWIYYRRPSPLGWAWLVPKAEPVSYKSDYRWIREKLRDPAWDPQRLVWVEKQAFEAREEVAARNASNPAHFVGRVEVEHPWPELWRFKTSSNDQGWLVVSKTWYHGWKATVDGVETKLVRANGPLTALAVPAGDHIVELRYSTPWFGVGAAVSSLTLLLTLVGLVFGLGPFGVCRARAAGAPLAGNAFLLKNSVT